MVSPLLLSLRQATAGLHARLESTPCMARLGCDDLQAVELARALAVLSAGFAAIESGLITEVWYRPQLPALLAELQRLPPVPPVAEVSPLRLPDRAARLGAAYVLIGSRLGAKSIAKRLRLQFGEAFIADSVYYGSEAEYAPAQWAALNEHLLEAGAAPAVAGSATTAAQAAFGQLIALSVQAWPNAIAA
jgi:heme oxygenase